MDYLLLGFIWGGLALALIAATAIHVRMIRRLERAVIHVQGLLDAINRINSARTIPSKDY